MAVSLPVVVLVIIGLSVATPVATDVLVGANITPPSPAYPLERAGEYIRLALTTDPKAKAMFYANLAEERLMEMQACAEAGRTDLVERMATQYQYYLSKCLNICREAEAEGHNMTEVYEIVENATLHHQEVLQEVKQMLQELPASEQAIAAIDKALEESKKGHEEASEHIPHHAPPFSA